MGSMNSKTIATVVLTVTAVLGSPSRAVEIYDVADSNGVPFMRVRILSADEADPESSSRNLSRWEIDQVLTGIQYWAEIIKVIPGQSPAMRALRRSP